MSSDEQQIRHVLFVSDSTGITAETLGRNLLNQFPLFKFTPHTHRFINTEEKAKKVLLNINQLTEKSPVRPIVISTLVNYDLRKIIASSNAMFMDVFDNFIDPLEKELGTSATLGMGKAHGILNDDYYAERIDAVNYSVKTDDGVRVYDYQNADVILTGVSRTGKTPTSLYLALHYGLATANYPLDDDDLEQSNIPRCLDEHKEKIFGLLISPENLHHIRQKRRLNSPYSSFSQCQYEIRRSKQIFIESGIPYFDVSNMSVEEVSSTIMNLMNLKPRTFVP